MRWWHGRRHGVQGRSRQRHKRGVVVVPGIPMDWEPMVKAGKVGGRVKEVVARLYRGGRLRWWPAC